MNKERYNIRLDFEAIKIPPVTDILVLGSNYKHGKIGIFESFKYLVPEKYLFHDYDDENNNNVGTIVISKKILRRMGYEKIIQVLKENVFPYIDESEAINVNFNIRQYVEGIEISGASYG